MTAQAAKRTDLPTWHLNLTKTLNMLPMVPVRTKQTVQPIVLNMLAPPSGKFLLALSALRNGVALQDLLSTRRNDKISEARRDAVCLLFAHTNKSKPQIGRLLGIDHTSVYYHVCRSGAVRLCDKPVEPPLPPRQPRAPRVIPDSPFRKAIRRGYGKGVSPADIADAYGTTVRSVYVTACMMGVTKPKRARAGA